MVQCICIYIYTHRYILNFIECLVFFVYQIGCHPDGYIWFAVLNGGLWLNMFSMNCLSVIFVVDDLLWYVWLVIVIQWLYAFFSLATMFRTVVTLIVYLCIWCNFYVWCYDNHQCGLCALICTLLGVSCMFAVRVQFFFSRLCVQHIVVSL